MFILLEEADREIMYMELFRRNFKAMHIYDKKTDTLILYLRNLGVKRIEIQ